ncbi:hypothetical protein CPC08DRAFT_625847 [Agrocybe pediades]|nr:hypothetical protein CPC08DRAFT_625847 [Agrocybe pediades]
MQLEADERFVPHSSLISLKFHPDFESSDGNVVLAAKDAKLYFRVHSHTLRTTSGFFRTMYSLPHSRSDIIYLDEDAEILEHLLFMICGLPFPEITSDDLLDSILFAAEKYDMPGPMSILRMYLSLPSLATVDPIRLYGIARRYDWEKEAKHMSALTLTLDIYNERHHTSIRTLSTDAALDLFLLHRARREGLRTCLDGPPFVSGEPSTCAQCETPITFAHSTWRELKHRMVLEIDRRPLGDTILDCGLNEWAEAVACWKAACVNDGCKRLLYDRAETIRVIRDCIGNLPKST